MRCTASHATGARTYISTYSPSPLHAWSPPYPTRIKTTTSARAHRRLIPPKSSHSSGKNHDSFRFSPLPPPSPPPLHNTPSSKNTTQPPIHDLNMSSQQINPFDRPIRWVAHRQSFILVLVFSQPPSFKLTQTICWVGLRHSFPFSQPPSHTQATLNVAFSSRAERSGSNGAVAHRAKWRQWAKRAKEEPRI